MAKTDPRLRDALTAGAGPEGLRVLLTLRGREVQQGPEPLPEQFHSREAYRAALIERRRKDVEQALGDTLEALTALGLRVVVSPVMRTVIADGTGEQVSRALDLPGVERAVLDRPLELIFALPLPLERKSGTEVD